MSSSTVSAPAHRPLKDLLLKRGTVALAPALIAMIVVGAFTNEAFLLPANWITILQQSSVLALLVLAESLVLISGKFDLSLESTVGLAPMIGAWLVSDTALGGSGLMWNPFVAIAVTLVVGVVIGVINGFLIMRLRLNAFIVTLSMLILLRGITLGLTSGQTLYDLPPAFTYLGSAVWLGMPSSVWIAGILFAVGGGFMRYHRYGRAIYAIGGNADAARAAGIRVERLTWIVYVVASLLAALAGLLLSGRLGSVTAQQGSNLIFTTFAAAVIGGISLNGGKGSLLGAVAGVLLLGIVTNILTLSQIASFWIDATFGAIILVAQCLNRLTGGERSQQ